MLHWGAEVVFVHGVLLMSGLPNRCAGRKSPVVVVGPARKTNASDVCGRLSHERPHRDETHWHTHTDQSAHTGKRNISDRGAKFNKSALRWWSHTQAHVPASSRTFGRGRIAMPAVWPLPPCCRWSPYELLQVGKSLRDYLRVTSVTQTPDCSHQCSQVNGFSFLKLFYSFIYCLSFFLLSPLPPSIPLATCLAHPPSLPSPFLSSALLIVPSLLYSLLPLYFFPLLLLPFFTTAQLCRGRLVCSYLWGRSMASCMLKPNQLMLIKEVGYGHLFTQNTKLIWITRWNNSHLLNWKIYFCPPCFNLGGGGHIPYAKVMLWE